MVPVIDFEECLRDSPKFRATLEGQEADIEQLEQKLDKLLKVCGVMVDVGKTYVAQQSQFANGLWDLSTYFREDPEVMACLNKLIHALQEMNKFHTILLDQASRTVLKNITSFVKGDIKGVKESRHYFEKISTDLDGALSRNSQLQHKARPSEAEETQNLLAATRSCFRHTALDYVHSISLVQAKKRHEVLGTLLSYMHACNTFFHQGHDLCQDLDPFFKTLAEEVVSMRQECQHLEKDMENRHSHVTSQDVVKPTRGESRRMEGYLFKRTSNAFKTWNRRWFSLQDNQLVYRKRTGEENVTVMEEDLRLCTVKPVNDSERRFCFEVLSPSKSHTLQADSEEMYHLWIAAMQKGIGAAFQQSMSVDCIEKEAECGDDKTQSRSPSLAADAADTKPRMWQQLLKIPGNDMCCDCGSPSPRWASINLGITLCIECSGVHRSLGVHHSKVRSLTLDAWEPEIIKVMVELGNSIVNKVYEATVTAEHKRATPKCTGDVRKAWITAKYMERRFVKPIVVESPGARSRSNAPVRKWSVRKMRRRPRSTDTRGKKAGGGKLAAVKEKKGKEGRPGEEADMSEAAKAAKEESASLLSVDLEDFSNTLVESESDQETSGKASDKASEETKSSGNLLSVKRPLERLVSPKTAKDRELPASSEVLLFGAPLEDEPLENTVELSSDQDSTGGEEEEPLGEEDISTLHPDLLLYKAAAAHNLPVMCEALALHADKLWVNELDSRRSPIHQAIISGSVMACEYLLLNGAKINAQDGDGKTPLHLATELGHTAQVCLLLKHRADQHLLDGAGADPIALAVRDANADIVTLLRLALLDEEMKASELGSNGDDTFNDVVRDFTQLACSHPERLMRGCRMEHHHRETINRHLAVLADSTKLDLVRDTLFKKGVFNERMAEVFKNESVPLKQRARDMYEYIETRGPNAFSLLVETMLETGHVTMAKLLDPNCDSTSCGAQLRGGEPTVAGMPENGLPVPARRCHPTILPNYYEPNSNDIHNIGVAMPNSFINIGEETKPVKVKLATERRDRSYVPDLHVYPMGSRPKGMVLMINNIKFLNDLEAYRSGAEKDDENLKHLFQQLGYTVFDYRNKTHKEMTELIQDFARHTNLSRVCSIVVAVMSHGKGHPRVQEANQPDESHGVVTHVVATDRKLIETEWIVRQFNGTNCPAMMRKPKVFLFQVCRGDSREHAIRAPTVSAIGRTSQDGMPDPDKLEYMRSSGDILIAYSTVPGKVSNRDTALGTWYVQAICEIFMDYACMHDIEDMLKMVDGRLSNLTCENLTMQTSCYENRGFRKFYFNPGLYDEPSQETPLELQSLDSSSEPMPMSQEDLVEQDDSRPNWIRSTPSPGQDSQEYVVRGMQSQQPMVQGTQSQPLGSQAEHPMVQGTQSQPVGSQSQQPMVQGTQSQPLGSQFQQSMVLGTPPDPIEECMDITLNIMEHDLSVA